MSGTEADVLVAVQDALLTDSSERVVLGAARGLSHFGEHALGWFALAGTGAVVSTAGGRTAAPWVELGVSAFTAHAASVVLKRIVRRRRPSDPRIRVGVGTPSRLSFPSSHATSTAAALTALSRITGSRLPLAGVPVMMASRLVLGVHYPTDVLAGVALGVATEKTVHRTVKEIKR
ncbi:phosphatase PAP2 family protein [Corynebacterium sp.]|uniref:phosphatase PAP2 family protein n=1 Tax=Corynebacterium sp. TaxID=1720 RepID=UPI0028B21312|nr:phosphatase PAP2 family protein [Corynebacterium sp.]